MVSAIASVHGISLGRPHCAEPRLCAHIPSGKVRGVILSRIDPNDFVTTAVAARAQTEQVAQGQMPIDLSYDENVKYFMKALQDWFHTWNQM
jgi:hypothetical protein